MRSADIDLRQELASWESPGLNILSTYIIKYNLSPNSLSNKHHNKMNIHNNHHIEKCSMYNPQRNRSNVQKKQVNLNSEVSSQ